MAEEIRKYQNAVDVIKTAILQSQARAAKAVNQEQLALYYGIGRYVSANSRKKNWGKGAIDTISEQLRKELPGLRGFSATSMRNMRTFYEEWRQLENNSSVATDEITKINTSANSVVGTTDFADDALVELTLPKDANIYAQQYALCLPDKALLQQKLREWIAEFKNEED